jgi:hypothetical protein
MIFARGVEKTRLERPRGKLLMARLRAVVMIHPAGLGGNPLDGQRSAARPYSSRKTRSISEATRAGERQLTSAADQR